MQAPSYCRYLATAGTFGWASGNTASTSLKKICALIKLMTIDQCIPANAMHLHQCQLALPVLYKPQCRMVPLQCHVSGGRYKTNV